MASLLILVPFFAAIVLNAPFKALRERWSFGLSLILFLGQTLLMIFPRAGLWASCCPALDSLFHFPLRVDVLSTVLLFCIGAVLTATLLLSSKAIPQGDRRINFSKRAAFDAGGDERRGGSDRHFLSLRVS